MSSQKDEEAKSPSLVQKGSAAALSFSETSDLPRDYRDQISQHYDLPNIKVNLFDILRYGDRTDYVLMLLGGVMSVGGGYATSL